MGVVGGKGGAGKTLVAVNLAVLLGCMGLRVVLGDLDVEAPNACLVAGGSCGCGGSVLLPFPVVDAGRCLRCGVCGSACGSGALVSVRGRLPLVVNPRLCSGCRACIYRCPVGALVESCRVAGCWGLESVATCCGFLDVFTCMLGVGEEHVSSVVSWCLGRFLGLGGYDVYVVDVGAGAGAGVASVVSRCGLVVLVVEDSVSGVSDALRVLGVVERLGVPYVVVVNKEAGGPASRRRWGGALGVVRVPYDWRVVCSSLDSGVPVVCGWPGSGVARSLSVLAGIVAGLAGGGVGGGG